MATIIGTLRFDVNGHAIGTVDVHVESNDGKRSVTLGDGERSATVPYPAGVRIPRDSAGAFLRTVAVTFVPQGRKRGTVLADATDATVEGKKDTPVLKGRATNVDVGTEHYALTLAVRTGATDGRLSLSGRIGTAVYADARKDVDVAAAFGAFVAE